MLNSFFINLTDGEVDMKRSIDKVVFIALCHYLSGCS